MTLTTYINNHGKKAGVIALSSWTGGVIATENDDGTFNFDFDEHLLLLGTTVWTFAHTKIMSNIADYGISKNANRI